MKSRIFLLIIVLLSTLQISFANNKIDNLFKKTKELPNAEVSLSIAKSPATVHNVLVYYLSLYLIMRIEKHRDKQFERLPIILRTIAPEKCVFSYSYFICTKLVNISNMI